MTWPEPHPGLVIRYCYLWNREFLRGQEEGSKDRPCAVVIAQLDRDGVTEVHALPITHSPPAAGDLSVEIPAATKARLGLDGEKSWIVLSEVNVFAWPGPDLRFLPEQGPATAAYGFLPPKFFRFVRDKFLEANRTKRTAQITRTE